MIDFACKACGPSGRVLVGDGPYMVGVWERVTEASGLRAIETYGQWRGSLPHHADDEMTITATDRLFNSASWQFAAGELHRL